MISNSAATHAKVAIYIRVSTLHQIDRDSLPMQRQDLIAYAKLILNTDDVTIFEDAGYSGKNTIRPEFQKMMSQLRTGTYTHLLVWKIDRISRNLLDFAEMYQELKDLGVTFVSKNEQFDTSTAMGEAMLKIILVFAELERNMTSERVTATMISRASNGQWNGGRIPYGYDYDPEEQDFSFNSDEYNIAHLIHDKYEELRSLVYLARYLNEHGYRTRAGNDWSPVSLDIILRSVFYCGDYQYNRLKEGDRQRPKDKSEWITVKDHHPAIVSREQKERILALLESNRRLKSFRKSGKSKYTHIFSGLLICGNCGQPMTSSISTIKKTTGRRYSLYFCPTHRKSKLWCTGKSTSDPIIGEFVFNYILNMLNAQKAFSSETSIQELEQQLLSGDTFSPVAAIAPDGLQDLFHTLRTGTVKGEVFGKDVKKGSDISVRSLSTVNFAWYPSFFLPYHVLLICSPNCPYDNGHAYPSNCFPRNNPQYDWGKHRSLHHTHRFRVFRYTVVPISHNSFLLVIRLYCELLLLYITNGIRKFLSYPFSLISSIKSSIVSSKFTLASKRLFALSRASMTSSIPS